MPISTAPKPNVFLTLLTRAYPPLTTITALDQPHALLQFHVFTILQIHRKQQTSDQLPH
ncbi:MULTISPECIES: hypothetical protein [unclassified Bartonella]|uniref:hypothetical protein n=1 Tax=unclassified Bartonella TaxID=2645622 RepID=UPI0035D0EE3C